MINNQQMIYGKAAENKESEIKSKIQNNAESQPGSEEVRD